MIAIADTGFVVAVGSHKDKHHTRCIEVYHRVQKIVLPQSVLTEAAYLLLQKIGVQQTAGLLRGLGRTKYTLTALEIGDLTRSAELLSRYADSELDFVDTTVVAVAERLNIKVVLTIDRRDFSMIRPSHAQHFELLPETLG
jgi:uncharacterized protein